MVTPQHNGVFKPGIIPRRMLEGSAQEVKKEATPNQIKASHVQKAAVQAGMPPSSNFQTASRSKISTCSYPKWMTKLVNFAKDVVTNIKNHILVLKMDTAEKKAKLEKLKASLENPMSSDDLKDNQNLVKIMRLSGLPEELDNLAKDCEIQFAKLKESDNSHPEDVDFTNSPLETTLPGEPAKVETVEQKENNPVSETSTPEKEVKTDQPRYVLTQKTYSSEDLDKAFKVQDHSTAWVPVKINYANVQKFNLRIIDHVNPREISATEVVGLIKNCVANNDRNGLRQLANMLFDGSYGRSASDDNLRSVHLLREMFFHPGVNNLAIGKMMAKAFSDWQDNYRVPQARFRAIPQHGITVNNKPVAAQEDVTIYHGGGLNNIKRFMNGESSGYQLEAGHVGLQVCCGYNDRMENYAGSAWGHFDLPAGVSAKVKAENLIPANSSSEAGLAQSVEDYSVEVYRDSKPRVGVYRSSDFARDAEGNFIDQTFDKETWEAIGQSLDEFYGNNPGLENQRSLDGFPASYFLDSQNTEFEQSVNALREKAFVRHSPPEPTIG